jgi:hypothetical protein
MIKSRLGFYGMIAGMVAVGLVYFRAMRPIVEKITRWLTREK